MGKSQEKREKKRKQKLRKQERIVAAATHEVHDVLKDLPKEEARGVLLEAGKRLSEGRWTKPEPTPAGEEEQALLSNSLPIGGRDPTYDNVTASKFKAAATTRNLASVLLPDADPQRPPVIGYPRLGRGISADLLDEENMVLSPGAVKAAEEAQQRAGHLEAMANTPEVREAARKNPRVFSKFKKDQKAALRAQQKLSEVQDQLSGLNKELKKLVTTHSQESVQKIIDILQRTGELEKLVMMMQNEGVLNEHQEVNSGKKQELEIALAHTIVDVVESYDLDMTDILESKEIPKEHKDKIVGMFCRSMAACIIVELYPDRFSLTTNVLWSDQELTRTGMALWGRTYRRGASDEEMLQVAQSNAKNWGVVAGDAGVLVNERRIAVVAAVMAFSAKWAVHAFQRITTTHTFGAALMCSDADRSALEDIEMQWHAFMVMLPNGLLSYEDDEKGGLVCEYNRILVSTFDDSAQIILLNQGGAEYNHRIVVQVSNTIADVLDVKAEFVHSTDANLASTMKDKVQRVMVMAKRLVAGLLLSLQHQNNFKTKTTPARGGLKQREGEPEHRVVFVGRPLTVDCRHSVRDYIKSGSPKRKGAPPSVQSLTRGHFKRQVIGVGRSGRKVIWIEPYWRGPEDAPILTRPKHVG